MGILSAMNEPTSSALLFPLRMPGRALRDLDTIAAAVVSLERSVLTRLGSIEANTAQLAGQIAVLQVSIDAIVKRIGELDEGLTVTRTALLAEVALLRAPIERMAGDLGQATAMLPEQSGTGGPITRLRDALSSD